MTHEEQRVWMIRYLLDENPCYEQERIPDDIQGQKNLLRALMNVRMPDPISDKFLRIQDEYLQEENRAAGITDADGLEPCRTDRRLVLWQGDITALKADAITNPANSALLGCFRSLHNCVDNLIHSKAGIQLRLRCSEIMEEQGHEEPAGRAKITPGYNLPARYVLHTVGPIVNDPLTHRHRELLASCYRSCLELASEHHLNSLAFCCISTGVFMFPQKEAAETAVRTVRGWLDTHPDTSVKRVIFNVYKDEDLRLYDALLNQKI